jgi:HPt (histidine-containing phosphotransfer) domain-containing protein
LHFGAKGAAQHMGRFTKVRKSKVERGDKVEHIIKPIGMIWFDCLDAYKKNGPELESFALNAVVEEELGSSKLDFEGNFETLFHGTRADRQRLKELLSTSPVKARQQIAESLEISIEIMNSFEMESDISLSPTVVESNRIAQLEEWFQELKDDLEELEQNIIERGMLYLKLKNTYNLFLDYSIQDTQLLYDLEKKLDKFRTLMMLAQYNVSFFDDVFSTIKQVEQGITNFAHLKLNKVVIDRKYDLKKQIYNKHIDSDLLNIRINRDTKFNADDSEKVKELKRLVSQDTIPGAHVLLPQIGLISVKEDTTPKLAEEYQNLWQELLLIQEQLDQLDDE